MILLNFLLFIEFKSEKIINTLILNENDYIIISVLFQNCSNNDNGGSILINSNNLIIIQSYFYYSQSTLHGGAIYGSILNISILNTCFYQCINGLSNSLYGSAIFLFNINNINSNYLSINQCPSLNSEKPYHCTILYKNGNQISKNINSSYTNHRRVSGLFHWYSLNSIITFYLSINQNSGSIIGFGNFNFLNNHSNLLFFNNTINEGIFHMSNCNTSITNSIFLKNNGNLSFNIGKSKILIFNSYFDNFNIININYHEIINFTIINNFNYSNLLINCFNFYTLNNLKLFNLKILFIFLLFII